MSVAPGDLPSPPPERGLLRVALTGGIATGKSHCLRAFVSLNVPVIDADVLAREAVAPGTPGLAAVAARFGGQVLNRKGELDREALGRVVFGDPNATTASAPAAEAAARAASARRDLEAILHPMVYARIQDWFATQARAGARLAVADIPLLYETGHERDFDVVLVAACSPAEQLRRLMARDGLSEVEARRRIAAQLPIDDKRARGDVVIDTSGTVGDTDGQVQEFVRRRIGGNRDIGVSG